MTPEGALWDGTLVISFGALSLWSPVGAMANHRG
jgi:hypothetical protein